MIYFPRVCILPAVLVCLGQPVAASDANASLADGQTPELPAPTTLVVSEHQLSLPKSYREYTPALYRAAMLVSQMEACVSFIRGELQRDRSSIEYPIFRILCRGKDNKSFALLVDGATMHLLDETRPGGKVSFDELQREIEAERERQRVLAEQLAEEAKRLEAIALQEQAEEEARLEFLRRARLWEHCSRQLDIKVRNMRALSWLTTSMPEPHSVEEKQLSYYIDFDAEDIYGKGLHYRAECKISSENEFGLQIRPRKNFPVAEPGVLKDGS